MSRTQEAVAARRLPVAVVGGGPIGLVAAAHLLARGESPVVLEAGNAVGSSIRRWAHVRLFSPWKYVTEPVSRGMLESAGWEVPDGERLPTGGEFVEQFLEPLAALPAMAPHIRLGREVVAISRKGFDKAKAPGRSEAPFEVVARTADGRTERRLARAVIDASGTYTTPNPIGASGLAAEGEAELGDRIHYGIPDVLGCERHRYAGRRTLVVGSGHSAFSAVLDLTRLAEHEEGTEVVWAVRRKDPGLMFGGGDRDALPARASLGAHVRDLVDSGAVEFVTGFHTELISRTDRGILVAGEEERLIGPVDRIIAATGFRPDLGMLRELRTDLDSGLEAPTALARLIDPNLHSCGTVHPHGYEELEHPERDFFVVGMKSYGRAPTFLMLTGYEQVRSVICALTGDLEGARAMQLALPETGVCSTDLAGWLGTGASPCCGTAKNERRAPIAGSCGIGSACTSPAAIAAVKDAEEAHTPVLGRDTSGRCCG